MNGTSSVEIAPRADAVLIRDVKDHGAGPQLRVSYPQWHAFLSGEHGLSMDLDGLAVSHHDRVTAHDGVWVHTCWHLRDQGGVVLHFTDAEWAEFWTGVLDSDEELLDSLLLG